MAPTSQWQKAPCASHSAFTIERALLITILEIAHTLNWDSKKSVYWLLDSWISAYCGETSTTTFVFNFLIKRKIESRSSHLMYKRFKANSGSQIFQGASEI